MTPEAKVKAEIDEYLKSLGADCWFFAPMMMGYGRRGIPDRVGIYLGHGFTIELKRKGGATTPWQEREANAVDAAHGMAFRGVTSVTQITPWFEAVKAARRAL